MATNFPGPYEVRLFYTTSGLQHQARYNCFADASPTPGTASNAINLVQKDASLINLETAVDDWIALLAPVFNTAATFDRAELWQYEVGTTNATFIAAWTIGSNGSSATSPNLAHQDTLTWRTLEGNILKVVLLDGISISKDQVSYAADLPAFKAIADYVVSNDDWIIGKDTSFPVAYIRRSGGENEALARRRYR